MDSFDRLIELLEDLPGIGPKQAKRFAYYIRSRDRSFAERLSTELSGLHTSVSICPSCYRLAPRKDANLPATCRICLDSKRDKSQLMVVHRDVDLEAVERSGIYKGLYFVLGGSVPILDKEPERRIRLGQFVKRVQAGLAPTEGIAPLAEIILALHANPEGDHTEYVLRERLDGVITESVRLTRLGRGLSTGTELEYSDKETIRAALTRRDQIQD